MRSKEKIACLLLVSAFAILLTQCKKEDSEKVRRETFTNLLLNNIEPSSLEADVAWLQNMGTRFALAGNHKKVAADIKNKFIQLGYSDAEIDSFHIMKTYRNVTYEQMQYNVIATLEGTLYPDSVCVLGAHYDDILSSGDPFTDGRGANDNASGVAGILEIARVMKANNFKPETTIKFVAFGAEEIGLMGSNDFASDQHFPLRTIRFMLNFDMISYETSASKVEWYVNIIDYDNSHALRRETEMLCTERTSLQYRNDNTNYNRSDSYPFFMWGYKALFFFSDEIDPGYHTVNDIVSICNFEYCSEIVKLACALVVSKN
jgi:leucyl aminopeptidase